MKDSNLMMGAIAGLLIAGGSISIASDIVRIDNLFQLIGGFLLIVAFSREYIIK